MFQPATVSVLGPLDALVEGLLATPMRSPDNLLGCCLAVALGAAAQSDATGTTDPLRSLMSHLANWAREQTMPDGRKVADAAAELIAELRAKVSAAPSN